MSETAPLVEIVVEWVAGEAQRFEWEEATDMMKPVPSGRTPPEHYGCVPGARCRGDGELLDVILLRDDAVRGAGDRVQARIIGVLRRADGDHKLLGVDPRRIGHTHVGEVDPARLAEIWRWFWRRYALLGWFGPDDAARELAEARGEWAARRD